jgi:NAD(P)H-dependent flavin oxidoreductase YrpB (nitropropane dioxygenase family)
MNLWPDRRIQEVLGIDVPIIQAPMAGSVSSEMVIAISEAGGLGSLPCALPNADQLRAELGASGNEPRVQSTSTSFATLHPKSISSERSYGESV